MKGMVFVGALLEWEVGYTSIKSCFQDDVHYSYDDYIIIMEHYYYIIWSTVGLVLIV